MPKASIIIPVYNRSAMMVDAVTSAQNQTLDDIEIIVVDNASTDDSFEAALGIARKDKRVRVFRNDSNIGPVLNWKRGASLANSQYSKLLFSDDLLGPKYLENSLPFLNDPGCALVYSSVNVASDPWSAKTPFYNNFIGNTKIRTALFIHAAALADNFFPVSPGACISRTIDLQRNIFTNLSGFESEYYASTGAGVDMLFYCITALNYEYVQYIDYCEVYFRAHLDSMSAHPAVPKCYENAREFLSSALIKSR